MVVKSWTREALHNVPGGRSSCIRSSSLSSSWVKSLKGTRGPQMMLWVHTPDSKDLFRGFVKFVWGPEGWIGDSSSSSGSYIIWFSQLERRTRSNERSWRGKWTRASVCSRSCELNVRQHWVRREQHRVYLQCSTKIMFHVSGCNDFLYTLTLHLSLRVTNNGVQEPLRSFLPPWIDRFIYKYSIKCIENMKSTHSEMVFSRCVASEQYSLWTAPWSSRFYPSRRWEIARRQSSDVLLVGGLYVSSSASSQTVQETGLPFWLLSLLPPPLLRVLYPLHLPNLALHRAQQHLDHPICRYISALHWLLEDPIFLVDLKDLGRLVNRVQWERCPMKTRSTSQ